MCIDLCLAGTCPCIEKTSASIIITHRRRTVCVCVCVWLIYSFSSLFCPGQVVSSSLMDTKLCCVETLAHLGASLRVCVSGGWEPNTHTNTHAPEAESDSETPRLLLRSHRLMFFIATPNLSLAFPGWPSRMLQTHTDPPTEVERKCLIGENQRKCPTCFPVFFGGVVFHEQ